MHCWCVVFILPVLMAGALSPGDGCGFNTTVVAGISPSGESEAHFDYSTSVVDTGMPATTIVNVLFIVPPYLDQPCSEHRLIPYLLYLFQLQVPNAILK